MKLSYPLAESCSSGLLNGIQNFLEYTSPQTKLLAMVGRGYNMCDIYCRDYIIDILYILQYQYEPIKTVKKYRYIEIQKNKFGFFRRYRSP